VSDTARTPAPLALAGAALVVAENRVERPSGRRLGSLVEAVERGNDGLHDRGDAGADHGDGVKLAEAVSPRPRIGVGRGRRLVHERVAEAAIMDVRVATAVSWRQPVP